MFFFFTVSNDRKQKKINNHCQQFKIQRGQMSSYFSALRDLRFIIHQLGRLMKSKLMRERNGRPQDLPTGWTVSDRSCEVSNFHQKNRGMKRPTLQMDNTYWRYLKDQLRMSCVSLCITPSLDPYADERMQPLPLRFSVSEMHPLSDAT